MSDGGDTIECGEHGTRAPTFVCQHLVDGSNLGFHFGVPDDDPDVVWPDAWCDACDAVYRAEGGWNERSEAAAGVTAICDFCYERARGRNWREDERAFARLLEEALGNLQDKQQELQEQYGLSDYDRFDWNQGSGQLVFSQGGERRVVADIVFVGSISTRSNTWLWSWANDSFLEPLRAPLREVRRYGLEHRFMKLASARFPAEEADGWEMTAIAAHLLGAVGAYRTPGETGFSFMLMTRISWAQ